MAEGFFSWNVFSNKLIYTNWFLDPLIIRFNELLLKYNHALFHRFDMLHHAVHYICHILVVYFPYRLMLSGFGRPKYSSVFFYQQPRKISGLFLGLLKSLFLYFCHSCTAWLIHSSSSQYGDQYNDDTLPDYQLLLRV